MSADHEAVSATVALKLARQHLNRIQAHQQPIQYLSSSSIRVVLNLSVVYTPRQVLPHAG